MLADGITPPLPENPLPYLTEWLMEIGPIVPVGMGTGPIGWRDLAAWQEVTGQRLQPWEATLLRRLSAEFSTAQHRAEAADCPAPWVDDGDCADNRAAVSRKVAIAFKSMVQAQAGRQKPEQGHQ